MPLRYWIRTLPRMPRFWVALAFGLALMASLGRLAVMTDRADRLGADAATVTGTVVSKDSRIDQNVVRTWITYRYTVDGITLRATRRVPPSLSASIREGDPIAVLYLRSDPTLHEIDGEVMARPAFEWPVIALAAAFAAMAAWHLGRGVSAMARARRAGLAMDGTVTGVSEWGPVGRSALRAATPQGRMHFGTSLMRRRSRLRHPGPGRIPMLIDPASGTAFLAEDLDPPGPIT